MMSCVSRSNSALDGMGVVHAASKAVASAAPMRAYVRFMMCVSLSLDGRCGGFTAFAVDAHVDA